MKILVTGTEGYQLTSFGSAVQSSADAGFGQSMPAFIEQLVFMVYRLRH